MSITYRVEIDLSDAPPERMPVRLACITGMPDGAGLVVHVGALRAQPDVCRLLAEHGGRLDIMVYARNEHTARRWRQLVNEPDILVETP